MVTRPYLSITTLNINGLNAPMKRQRLTKKRKRVYCLQENHLTTRDTYRLKVMARKKLFCENGEQKKVGRTILISDKRILSKDHYKRQRRLHYIISKGSIKEEAIYTQSRKTSIQEANAIDN